MRGILRKELVSEDERIVEKLVVTKHIFDDELVEELDKKRRSKYKFP